MLVFTVCGSLKKCFEILSCYSIISYYIIQIPLFLALNVVKQFVYVLYLPAGGAACLLVLRLLSAPKVVFLLR